MSSAGFESSDVDEVSGPIQVDSIRSDSIISWIIMPANQVS